MEIRFSTPAHPSNLVRFVVDAAHKRGLTTRNERVRGHAVRFELCTWGNNNCTSSEHDDVIRALLTLDPEAVVRTARAVYDGREDFEAQVKARVK